MLWLNLMALVMLTSSCLQRSNFVAINYQPNKYWLIVVLFISGYLHSIDLPARQESINHVNNTSYPTTDEPIWYSYVAC